MGFVKRNPFKRIFVQMIFRSNDLLCVQTIWRCQTNLHKVFNDPAWTVLHVLNVLPGLCCTSLRAGTRRRQPLRCKWLKIVGVFRNGENITESLLYCARMFYKNTFTQVRNISWLANHGNNHFLTSDLFR